MVYGLRVMVEGFGSEIWGVGCRVRTSKFVSRSVFQVHDLYSIVDGLGRRVQGPHIYIRG